MRPGRALCSPLALAWGAHRARPNHRHRRVRTCGDRGNLHLASITVLMCGDLMHVDDVIGVVLALAVAGLVGELALLEVVEEAFVGHDVGSHEGTLHCLYLLARHSYYYIALP